MSISITTSFSLSLLVSSETAHYVNKDLPAFLDCYLYLCILLSFISPRSSKWPINDIINQTNDHQAKQLILLHFLHFCSNKQCADLSGLEQQGLFCAQVKFWLQYSHFLHSGTQKGRAVLTLDTLLISQKDQW